MVKSGAADWWKSLRYWQTRYARWYKNGTELKRSKVATPSHFYAPPPPTPNSPPTKNALKKSNHAIPTAVVYVEVLVPSSSLLNSYIVNIFLTHHSEIHCKYSTNTQKATKDVFSANIIQRYFSTSKCQFCFFFAAVSSYIFFFNDNNCKSRNSERKFNLFDNVE